MSTKIRIKNLALPVAALLLTAIGIIASATVWSQQDERPSTKDSAGPGPSRIIAAKTRKIPQLTESGKSVQASVSEFIKYAGDTGTDQREEIRKVLAAARDNKEAVGALCNEALEAQKEDHSRTLLVLSLLGETKSPYGADCLNRIVKLPFPEKGTEVDGEIIEQTTLATVQAKAIDGLAYLNTKESNEIVLNAVKNHPSIIVRAEAIEAYLWNNSGKAAQARQTLLQYVRKGEEIYLDRVRRETGEKADTFNRKVEAFLKAHPEARPPKPEAQKEPQKPKNEKPGTTVYPPKF